MPTFREHNSSILQSDLQGPTRSQSYQHIYNIYSVPLNFWCDTYRLWANGAVALELAVVTKRLAYGSIPKIIILA